MSMVNKCYTKTVSMYVTTCKWSKGRKSKTLHYMLHDLSSSHYPRMDLIYEGAIMGTLPYSCYHAITGIHVFLISSVVTEIGCIIQNTCSPHDICSCGPTYQCKVLCQLWAALYGLQHIHVHLCLYLVPRDKLLGIWRGQLGTCRRRQQVMMCPLPVASHTTK